MIIQQSLLYLRPPIIFFYSNSHFSLAPRILSVPSGPMNLHIPFFFLTED